MDNPHSQEETTRRRAAPLRQILTAKPDSALDHLTRLASAVLKAPIAAISYIDDERIALKSPIGLTASGWPVTACPCAHIIRSGTPLTVPDTDLDARFSAHPMVASSHHLRFYAGAPLVTSTGDAIGVLFAADIRPRKIASEDDTQHLRTLAALVIDMLERRLEHSPSRQSADRRSAFLSTLSHELRTPMNGVLGMAELLLTADDIDERHRRRIQVLHRSSETLLTLLDQFLELSKLQDGDARPNPTPFRLRDLIRELEDHFRPLAHAKSVGFDVDDRIEVEDRVIGDSVRLRQSLSNILDRAIGSVVEGGVSVTVAADSGESGRIRTIFDIEVTGDGSHGEAIQRLRSAMKQPDDLDWSVVGRSELGLVHSMMLVDLLRGRLDIEMRKGQCSAYRLVVDLEAEAGIHGLDDVVGAQAASGKPSESLNILIAEDEPDMASLIEEFVEEAGHHATIAHDGASVLRLLDERAFDLVLMDGRMPDMTGLEATRRIRSLADTRARIPIIALTGNALTGDRERFLAAGMNDFIAKPFDYEGLVEAIERCCGQKPACSSALSE